MSFEHYDIGPFYDEMFAEAGQPRTGCALLAETISGLPPGELRRRQKTAEKALFDMGAYELEIDADGDGLKPSEGDCDDTTEAIQPGAPERCEDGIDQDCDGEDLSCSAVDQDGDGFSEDEGDCNDDNVLIYPDATEYPNEVDDNCNGELDEGLYTPSPTPAPDDTAGCSCSQPGQRSTGAGSVPSSGLLLWLAGLGGLIRLRRRTRAPSGPLSPHAPTAPASPGPTAATRPPLNFSHS